MKILKLVLSGYKRLFLNNIDYIEYTPDSKMQILLGQNGSGKSSLLEQLTPISPNIRKDFTEDGYREITIEHQDQLYILRNSRSTGHSFQRDGVELNDAGTITVQNKLVAIHFNITPHIQNILIGKNMFTNMSANERKKWISEMSTIDYSYAISVYNSLRQRHRDIVGGIKLLQSNIIKVTRSSLQDTVVTSLTADQRNLKAVIDHMHTLIDHKHTSSGLDKAVSDVESLVTDISKVSDGDDHTIEQLRDARSQLSSRLHIARDRVVELYKELSVITDSESEDLKQLQDEVGKIVAKKSSLLSDSRLKDIRNLEVLIGYLKDNYTDMISLLSELSPYHDTDVSKDRMLLLQSQKVKLENGINALDKDINRLEERLRHLKEHNHERYHVECPKCNHKWNPDYTQDEYDRHLSTVTELNEKRSKYDNKYKEITQELELIDYIRSIVVKFHGYFNYSDDTRYLIQLMTADPLFIKDKHGSLFTLYESMYSELLELEEVIELDKKKKVLDDKIAICIQVNKAKESMSNINRDKLESEIAYLRKDINAAEAELVLLDKSIRNKQYILDKSTELKSKLKEVYTKRDVELYIEFNKLLKENIRTLRANLDEVEDQLKHHHEYEALLSSYNAELKDLSRKEKLLQIAIKKLSPTEGLIAKSISSFLNKFIQEMNHVISLVWGYSMEILSCDLHEDDLDYKFRVLVNNDEIIEDVSKTSSSMQEMINLVFKVTFSKFMGYMDYPLILDEFGRTFDAAHRISAYEALDRSIAHDFSQVYMVSHFESMYGRFGTADISVLGTNGVDLNTVSSYNEVMILK